METSSFSYSSSTISRSDPYMRHFQGFGSEFETCNWIWVEADRILEDEEDEEVSNEIEILFRPFSKWKESHWVLIPLFRTIIIILSEFFWGERKTIRLWEGKSDSNWFITLTTSIYYIIGSSRRSRKLKRDKMRILLAPATRLINLHHSHLLPFFPKCKWEEDSEAGV